MRSQVYNPIKILMNMMPLYYTVDALVLALYDKDREDMECPATDFYCHYKYVFQQRKSIAFFKSIIVFVYS